MSAEPLVTLVTPVYNGEKYLSQCIESVSNQTYSNWEYIIVNNRSTDRSLEIAESYAKKDSRIRIQNNPEFVGVIQNHNIAFRQLSPASSYCKVVQADDWLFPQCLAQMVAVAEANPSVGIVGSYSLDNARVKCDGLPYPSTVIPGRESCRLTLLGQLYVFLSPTSLLIRSDVIRNVDRFYDEAHIYADVEACYEVLQHLDFGFVHQVLTYIRKHSRSMTATFARRLNALILADLYFLTKYGPVYLSRGEYKSRFRRVQRDYYRFLARSVLQLREREFWKYHMKELRQMGCRLSPGRLLAELSLEILDIVLNPKQTATAFIRKVFAEPVR